jgi:hypothetical protein
MAQFVTFISRVFKGAYSMFVRPTKMLRKKPQRNTSFVHLEEDCGPVYLTRGQLIDPKTAKLAQGTKVTTASDAPQKAVVVNLNEVFLERRGSKDRRDAGRRNIYDRRADSNKIVPLERRQGYERRMDARRLAEQRRLSSSPEFPAGNVELARSGTPENPARIFDAHRSLVTYLYKTEEGEPCIHVNFENNKQKSHITAEDVPGHVRVKSNQSDNQLLNITGENQQPIIIIAEGETIFHINKNSKGHFKIGSAVF